jgi:hypothetical protein
MTIAHERPLFAFPFVGPDFGARDLFSATRPGQLLGFLTFEGFSSLNVHAPAP